MGNLAVVGWRYLVFWLVFWRFKEKKKKKAVLGDQALNIWSTALSSAISGAI